MKESPSADEQAFLFPVGRLRRLRWVLLVATACFVIGIFLPMITISRFVLIKNSFSVVSGVLELLLNGNFFLFLVVAGFSIVLPLLKIGLLFRVLSTNSFQSPRIKRYLHLMHEYGRWSMLDVLVVAVLIVTVKLGAVADVQVHYGIWVFGMAVLLIMFVTRQVVSLTGDFDESGPGRGRQNN